MSEKKILEQILSNTEEVKEVVVTRENERQRQINDKKEKRKQQLKEAQKNFVQIKANVKTERYNQIKARCTDGNISAYLLKLIDDDLNRTPSLFESHKNESNSRNTESDELRSLKFELEQIRKMSFIQKFLWLFR